MIRSEVSVRFDSCQLNTYAYSYIKKSDGSNKYQYIACMFKEAVVLLSHVLSTCLGHMYIWLMICATIRSL